MAPLDMIVFVADKIEPTHDVAEYKRLYKQIGTMSLEELFYAVLKRACPIWFVPASLSVMILSRFGTGTTVPSLKNKKENISGRNIFS